MEFDRFLKYYENAEDLNLREKEKSSKGKNKSGTNEYASAGRGDNRKAFTRGGSGYRRLFVNLGTKDGFHKASFLQFILDMSDLKKEVLGKIDLKDMNSWIEIDKGAAQQMIRSIDGKKYRGRNIRMNDADNRTPYSGKHQPS